MDQPVVFKGSVTEKVRGALGIAAKGLPAIRAALWGARLGAGSGLTREVVQRLGVEVAEELPAVAKLAGRKAVVLGKDGVGVKLTAGGAVGAVVTETSVNAIAQSTTRTALAGFARAARSGAVFGAVIDGGFGVFEAVKEMRENKLPTRDAVILVGKRTARGAVVGGASVAAAGAASAVIAATGLTLVGAPVVVPLVTMAAAGVFASRGFDRVFGTGVGPRTSEQDGVQQPLLLQK